MVKKIGTFIILALVVLFAVLGYDYLHYRSKHAVSDAAFIKSDRLAWLAFKVKGKMIEMTKEENAAVKKGELLARIDPKDFLVTKSRVEKSIESLTKAIEGLMLKKERLSQSLALKQKIAATDIAAIENKMAALSFKIEAAAIRLKKLQKDRKRYANMLRNRLISPSEYERIQMETDALSDEISGMRRELDALQDSKRQASDAYRLAKVQSRQIAELAKEIQARQKGLDARKKELESVENKIAYTRLVAPFDGIVAKKFTDAPRVVKSGEPIYALTDPDALYCEVLLSEKKLHGVVPGAHVTITVEAIPDRTYSGIVESIAPTSASTFSLVPRDIASGEFTKLDQRFKIRIQLKEKEGLRAGMGATVAIERR